MATDYTALIEEARAIPIPFEEPVELVLLGQLADAVEALQAQLDNVATEWAIEARSTESTAIVRYFEHDRAACERFIENPPPEYTHRKGESFRIVHRIAAGPWVEVTD